MCFERDNLSDTPAFDTLSELINGDEPQNVTPQQSPAPEDTAPDGIAWKDEFYTLTPEQQDLVTRQEQSTKALNEAIEAFNDSAADLDIAVNGIPAISTTDKVLKAYLEALVLLTEAVSAGLAFVGSDNVDETAVQMYAMALEGATVLVVDASRKTFEAFATDDSDAFDAVRNAA